MDRIDYNLIYRNNPSWMPICDEEYRKASIEKAYKKKQEQKSTRPLEPVSPSAKGTKVVIKEDEKPQTQVKTKKRITYLADDGVRYDVEGSRVRNEVRENATYGKDGKRATV
ncbi:MAG: hypothetical protein MJ246_04520 [Clostridia bacterium]|nr:hypothetical protein [Clostridia bacterium]